jgi:hypothetical protein
MLLYVLSLRMRGNIHVFFLTVYLTRCLIKHRDNFILLFHEVYHISKMGKCIHGARIIRVAVVQAWQFIWFCRYGYVIMLFRWLTWKSCLSICMSTEIAGTCFNSMYNTFNECCHSMTMLVEIQQKITDTLNEVLYAFLCPSWRWLFQQLSVQEMT